ncbi:hypothetical protein C0Z11_08890 [Acidipropionibacterium jensenii]|uniref:hypothetical protein n=1 Tax=Acidipropionibacterium jensenii TaxID=1749 RepID=UPI000BC32A4A|nr:hypothetical protein [Acidipropionibacterium jensenii]AZZ42377.1 hypothetical protein C0Z11_08890 [Acidipropionibacterium jensenii]
MATIAKYNPDMTVDEITQELTTEAENEGTTLDVLAPQIAAEVEKEAAEVQKDREIDEAMSESSSQVSTRSSSGVSRDKILPHGKVLGDIYWTAAGAGWNHIGLYYHVDMAAEAPGKGQVSRVVYTNQVKVANNYGRYSIRVDKPYRVSAANWASRHRGKPYNLVFWNNKTIEASKYNCSQFVWASYKISGYDLDSDGGSGVYPDDIRDSSLLKHY